MCRQHIKQLANVGAKTVSNLGTFLHRAGQRAGQTVKVMQWCIQSGLLPGYPYGGVSRLGSRGLYLSWYACNM